MLRLLLLPLSFAICLTLYGAPLRPPAEPYHGLGGMPPDHRGYYPFIGHYNFRQIANHVIDQTIETFDPDLVKTGDIIYINIWYLPWFEKHVHSQIKNPYILASGDVGRWLPDPGAIKKLLYDPKCATWICRNMLLSYHPKIIQMPMGQDLALFGAPVDELEVAAAKRPYSKKHLLSMNFLPRPWGDRNKISKMFEDVSYCFTRQHSSRQYYPVLRDIYYADLGSSLFTLSPIGLEWDCTRTWESWVFDCIPIVEHSFLDPLYDGLPTVFVNDWTEINEQFLLDQYEKLQGYSTEKAYFDYWGNKLREIQKRIREGDSYFSQLEATKFEHQELVDLADIVQSQTKGAPLIMVCKGFLTTVRPLELLQTMRSIKRLYLHDPWMSAENFKLVEQHIKDKTLLAHKKKLAILNSESSFTDILTHASAIFFDMTYQRHSLLRDFNDFRHHLGRDLKEVCSPLPSGTLVCGNMANYPYVNEQLELLAKEEGFLIQRKGTIWFFVR